jgi:hypothetical protein
MMDWTDDSQKSLSIRCLQIEGDSCLLYVSSALAGGSCNLEQGRRNGIEESEISSCRIQYRHVPEILSVRGTSVKT